MKNQERPYSLRSVVGTLKVLAMIVNNVVNFGPRAEGYCLLTVMFYLAHPQLRIMTGLYRMHAMSKWGMQVWLLSPEMKAAQTAYDCVADMFSKGEITVKEVHSLLKPYVVGVQYATVRIPKSAGSGRGNPKHDYSGDRSTRPRACTSKQRCEIGSLNDYSGRQRKLYVATREALLSQAASA